MDRTIQFFLAIMIISVALGFIQNEPVLVGELSMSNDTSHLKKFEYDHVDPQTQKTANCTSFAVDRDYVLLANGSLYLPGSDSVRDYGTYFLQNGTAFLCDEDVSVEQTTTNLVRNFSKEFLECGHVLLEPDEFELLDNGDIRVPIYSRTYGPKDYYLQDHGVYVCVPPEIMQPNFTTTNDSFTRKVNKFSDSFTYVTYTGLTISVVSLLAHLAVFSLMSSVRNLPGCCLASLSLSLLAAYCCFLTAGMVNSSVNCPNLGMCVYYFFLTSFFWMNAIAFDVWRSFRVVIRELRISSHRVPWRRFLLYSLYSWCVPAVLTVIVKVFDSSDLLPRDLRPSFGDTFCWFGQRKALLVFFAVPLIVVMVLNAVFFLDVTYVISRATLQTSQAHEATLRKRFFMFMRLALIMGLTWIVGLIAGYANNVVLWYMFVLLNTLQGLFIFVVFSCSSKVRGLFCKGYRKRKGQSGGNTSVRTISQISATV